MSFIVFISESEFEQMWVRIRADMIWENRTVKLLGTTIDNKLKFNEHNNIYLHQSKEKIDSFDKNGRIFAIY